MPSDANIKILKRACREVDQNMLINLGIGLPQLLTAYIDPQSMPLVHAENGIVGVGEPVVYEEANPYCMDAGGVYVSTVPGATFMDSAVSFGLVRRGKVELSFLGAFQVSGNGDLANWHVPGSRKTGMGGALEIASYAKKLVILMRHQDKHGNHKLVKKCSFPLTARRCVDMIITEKAVFSLMDNQVILEDIAQGESLDTIRQCTEFDYSVSSMLGEF